MRNPAKFLKIRPSRSGRSVGSVLAAALVSVGLIAPLTQAPATAQTTPITWEECPAYVEKPNAECGRIDVPMHYDQPDGEKISVGFLRLKAEAPASRRGALFGNPGGPGGNAYNYFDTVGGAWSWPQEIRNEWDLIAVQPRGLAGSTPVECTTPNMADPLTNVTATAESYLSSGKSLRDHCDGAQRGYNTSITTENTARDWNEVRKALDEERISIMGLSYGTFLGSTYATMFPQHTDRVVLDSAMDPTQAWNGLMASQKAGYEQALHEYFNWVALNDDHLHMGDTPLKAYQYWSKRVVAESGTNPTVVPPPAQVGDLPPGLEFTGEQGAQAMTAAGKARVEGEGIVSRLLNPGAMQTNSPLLIQTRMFLPMPRNWEILAQMTNGTFQVPEQTEQPDPKAIEDMQAYVASQQPMQILQMCNENVVAPNYALVPQALWSNYIAGDIFDAPPAIFASGIMCQGAQPVTGPVHLDGSQLETRPLMIQALRDPQTPYQYHYTMANAMGAHVVTVHGPGHNQVAVGNPVVDRIVVDYLRTGQATATDAPGHFEAQGQ